MEDRTSIHDQCLEVVKNAEELPPEIKQYCVYEEKDGKRIYLDAYIPFVGDKYGQVTKILFYCTAQNLSERNEKVRKEYVYNPEKAVERLYIKESGTLNIDVGPVSCGVLPALAGLTLSLKGIYIKEDLASIVQYIAIANYYKYSLWNSKQHDLNPDHLEESVKERYDKFMLDNYIKHEIAILKPDYIFIFGKSRYELLNNYSKENALPIKLFRINDTAWLLRGGRWKEKEVLLSEEAERLVESYCRYIERSTLYPQYSGRIEQVKAYLKRYYFEIQRQL